MVRAMFTWSGQQHFQPIRQSTAAECGLACIGMIAGYHGHRTDLVSLRKRFEITLKGATVADLIAIASNMGFGARGIRCEPENLSELTLPAILHWDLNHFVVLFKVKGTRATIADPARGMVHLSLRELSNHFTGVALELSPTAEFAPQNEKEHVRLSNLVRFDRGTLKPIMQALLLSFVLQLFVIAAPFFIQLVIDEAILKGDVSLIIALAVGFAGLKLFEIATAFMRRVVFQLISAVLAFDLKSSIFHHLLRLPISYFHSRSMGDVQQRFNSLNTISRFIADGLVEAVVDGVLAVLIGIVLFIYDWRLALAVGVFASAYAALRIAFLRVSKRADEEQQIAQADEASRFLETLSAIQTVKVAGIETEREGIWRNIATETVRADLRAGNLVIGYNTLSEGLIGLSQIVIVSLAAFAVLQGNFSIGMITAFLAYKIQFEQRLISLIDKWAGLQLLGVHLDRVADIAMTEKEATEVTRTQIEKLRGVVTLENVGFRYAPMEPSILHDVSFEIGAGEFVALTGPSGQGKSTLLKLLVGLYPCSHGQILYDGRPISHWGVNGLRKQVGAVMQDDMLLPGSIEENVCLFDENIDHSRVHWACEIAQIHSTLQSLPMGYQTLIGDMGTTISGGQKQRLLLARALYRMPSILVIDEGTSQLDVKTESQINSALKELKITRIAAAHRPDTLAKADRVITIANGMAFGEGVTPPDGVKVVYSN